MVRPRHCDKFNTAALGHWPPRPLRLTFYLSQILLLTGSVAFSQSRCAMNLQWGCSEFDPMFLQYLLCIFKKKIDWFIFDRMNSLKTWPVGVLVLHSRSPSMCASLLYHRQGVVSSYWQLEGEGRGRGRRHSHSSSAEQNWPAGRDRYKEVSYSFFYAKNTLKQLNVKGN